MIHITSASLPMRVGMEQGAEVSSTLAKRREPLINGFTLHDTSSAPLASAEILNGVQKAWGFVPNLHRVLAESPAALEAYGTLWGIAEKTGFTTHERNIALAGAADNRYTHEMLAACSNQGRRSSWSGVRTTNSGPSTMPNAMHGRSRKRGSSASSRPGTFRWRTTRKQ
jgi:hypothetical protein